MPKVELSHPYGDHQVGDRIDVSDAEAKRLIRAGYARPATKPEAKRLGVDPATAATADK